MKVILCLADSLALPRINVSYKETWFYKLKSSYIEGQASKVLIDFIASFRRALTSSDIMQQYTDLVGLYDADLLIIQQGIVDCAPRRINDRLLMWRILIKVVNKLHLTSAFWFVIKRLFNRNKNTVYTNIVDYKRNIESLVNKFLAGGLNKQVLFVLIATPSSKFLSKSKFVGDNVRAYNKIIVSICDTNERVSFIDPLCSGDNTLFVEDGYHTNAKGNELVFAAVKNFIETKLLKKADKDV